MIALLLHNTTHLGYIAQIEYTITNNAFSFDSISISGLWLGDGNATSANVFVICNDNGIGTGMSGLIGNMEIDRETRIARITGKDFRVMLDTEIQLDYTDSSDSMLLSGIVSKVISLVRDEDVNEVIPWEIGSIPSSMNIDTKSVFGDLSGTYQVVNAWRFLKAYLAYYQVYLSAEWSGEKVVFSMRYHGMDNGTASEADQRVWLENFIGEFENTRSLGVNHTIATMSSDEVPHPSLSKVHYWLYSDNTIHQTTTPLASLQIAPVITRIYEQEYLAQAQVEAVYALAEARYPYAITISNSEIKGPIDMTKDTDVLDKIGVYRDGAFVALIPVSAKTIAFKNGLSTSKIKLGFKKMFLTDFVGVEE